MVFAAVVDPNIIHVRYFEPGERGDGGEVAISGTIVETGLVGGPAGVAGAGVLGWGIGRGIGHIPLIGGGTVDDGWQQIFTALFFPNSTPSPGASPSFKPLAGRYTPDEQRDWEHDRYKDECQRAISNPDPCGNLSEDIDRVENCINLMQLFDNKWKLGNRHADAIQQALNRLNTLKDQHSRRCTDK